MATTARMVNVEQRDSARWECDCLCGWSTADRVPFPTERAARRGAVFHLRFCAMLHP